MLALWKRMREYFGQSWVRQYGEVDGEAIHAWQEALLDYSEEQIARGVKASREWEGNFPPTLGQFCKLCLTVLHEEKKNFTEQRMEAEQKAGIDVPMIEHLARKATTDVAKRELEKMRRIMAGEEE